MTHIRRITFVTDEEQPIKNPNCCLNSPEQSIFDLTHQSSIAFTPFLQNKPSPNATFDTFTIFKNRVILCSSTALRMKSGDRKDYLLSRVSLWNQRIEHIEKISDRLLKTLEPKKAFHSLRRYSSS